MKKFLLMCFSFGFALSVWAQDRVVTGKVTSKEDGSPLPGVSVVLKGTTNGTSTDADGNYKLSVPSSGGVLTFSFIGLKSINESIGERQVVDLSMEQDATQLSEVVVTGAGGLKQKERELGAANTVVKSDVLTAGRSMNMAGGLQGKVAGLQINATSSGPNPSYRVVLRGTRSITGDNQALLVLDNVIVPMSMLANIDQNDIESVNVLQGPGAAAIYGSLASNGALIVTTKKGTVGKTDITFSQNTQFTQVAFLPKIQKQFGSGGSGYGIDPALGDTFSPIENQSYGSAFDGSLRPMGNSPLADGSRNWTTYNYKPGHANFWQIGVQQQSNFSLSTGDDKSTLFIAGQYLTSTGTTPGDKYTRGNLRVNGTRKIGNKILATFNTVFNPSNSDVTSMTSSIYDNLLNMPSNVDITAFKDWRNNKFATPDGFYNPWYLNPYWVAANYRQQTKTNYLTGSLELKYTPIKGLDLIAREGVQVTNGYQKTFNNGNNPSAYELNTLYYNSAGKKIASSDGEYNWYNMQSVTDFIAQYNKELGSNFHLNVVGGLQLIERNSRYLSASINGMVVPGLYNLSNGVGIPTYGQQSYRTRLVGVYGKATVSYKDFIFLTASGRQDSDSRLSSQNRSFFYPSIDASIVLSDAIPSIKDTNFINYLKIRGNRSKTGLVNLGNGSTTYPDYGAYYLQSTYSGNSYGFPYGNLAGYTPNGTVVSNSLKPEFTNSYEAGFDVGLLNDRVTLNATYYHTATTNQTVTTYVSNASGYSNYLVNSGKMSNQGVELTGNVIAFQNNNWNISFNGNYTYKTTIVNNIGNLPSLSQYTGGYNGTAITGAYAGQAYPTIQGIDYVRDPQGHVIVDGTTGLPSQNTSPTILGYGTPKNIVGFGTVVQWKGIRFSVLFEYRGGYQIFNGIGWDMDWSGTGYQNSIYGRKDFVFPNSVILTQGADPTKEASYTKNTSVAVAGGMNGGGNAGFWSDANLRMGTDSNYITSGDFVKLREASIAYSLPSSLLAKSRFIKNVTISAQGRNLFLWMAKGNYYTDPEYSGAGSTGNAVGINNLGQTPPVRYFGGTLSVSF